MSVNEKMTAIADRIRHYAYETGKLTLDDMANKIEMVNLSGYNSGFTEGMQSGYTTGFEEGKQAEYNAFWDNYQENGNRTDYRYGFSGVGWTESTYNPKYPIVPAAYAASSMYQYALVTKVKNVDFSNVLNYFTSIFNNCTKLKTIENIKLPTNCQGAFTAIFNNCIALEEFGFTGTIQNNGIDLHWSTKLNKASIERIINALSTTTSGLTVTLSAEAVANAFTNAEWEALEATKTNWNISLV